MSIEVSAPGKVILHGEHAVVYKKAAVAVTVGLETKVALSLNESIVKLHLKNLGFEKEWDLHGINTENFPIEEENEDVVFVNESIIQKITDLFSLDSKFISESSKSAVIAFLFLWIYIYKKFSNEPLHGCEVRVNSELSIGSGMGSSASYSVSLATAVLIVCHKISPQLPPDSKHLINNWAYQAERIFHGKPSGIDNTICTYGGALLFENEKIGDILPSLPNIKILLVNTKIPRNTKILVEQVRKQQMCFPLVVDSIMNAIDAISLDSWKFFKTLKHSTQGDININTLKELINMNHHLLNALNVSHPKLDTIHNVASKYSFSSKLTGAGGGGCAIILLPMENSQRDFIEALKRELQLCGFDVYDILLGCSGVRARVHLDCILS